MSKTPCLLSFSGGTRWAEAEVDDNGRVFFSNEELIDSGVDHKHEGDLLRLFNDAHGRITYFVKLT